MDILNHLNSQQKEAVTAEAGQILVLAGPGSGKTRVLTRRIAYLMSVMGISPYHILAVPSQLVVKIWEPSGLKSAEFNQLI